MGETNEVLVNDRGTRDERADARVGREGRGDDSGESYRPLVELTLVRVREFVREKEAVFWTFVFPVLLACAAASRFAQRPGVCVAVEAAPARAPRWPQAAAALAQSPASSVVALARRVGAGAALRQGLARRGCGRGG